jgi:uncharacterized protein DUF6542
VSRSSASDGGRWPSAGDGRGGWPPAPDDDGWGPSTAVYSEAAARNSAPTDHRANTRAGRGFTNPPPARGQHPGEPWAPAGPRSAREQRTDRRTERSVQALQRSSQAPERGVPWWLALVVLIVIAGIGGVIDTLGSIQVKGGFNIGIVVASIVAILMVRRSHMFPIVIAPPIVYSAAAVFQLYVRSSGLHDKKVVLDAAANYLVYGFPAIAIATAAVLIIAGVRLITRK